MLHTIEDLIERLEVMKNKAIELHRVRNQYSEISGKQYNREYAQALLDDIQTMAKSIAEDREGDEILTRMEYKR